MLRQRGGSSCVHGLATNGIIEENAKTTSEKRTSWNLTRTSDPERGREGEKTVAGGEVSIEMSQRVMTKLLPANDYMIAFKIPVGFVMWQKEFVEIEKHVNRIPANDLLPILDGNVIWESEFTKPHKGEEATQKLGNKQQVVVIGGFCVICDNAPQIIQGQGSFTVGSCSFEPFASAEGAFYKIG